PYATLFRAAEPAQLALFEPNGSDGSALVTAPKLPPLEQVPEPPLHRVRTLSYSALALFESCSYRYYAERVVGMREAQASGSVPGHEGLAATEIGDSVHFLLEGAAPERPFAFEHDGVLLHG